MPDSRQISGTVNRLLPEWSAVRAILAVLIVMTFGTAGYVLIVAAEHLAVHRLHEEAASMRPAA